MAELPANTRLSERAGDNSWHWPLPRHPALWQHEDTGTESRDRAPVTMCIFTFPPDAQKLEAAGWPEPKSQRHPDGEPQTEGLVLLPQTSSDRCPAARAVTSPPQESQPCPVAGATRIGIKTVSCVTMRV